MLIKIVKNTTRVVLGFILLTALLILYYITIGYQYYSLVKHNEALIINQVKNIYHTDMKYESIDEKWTNLKPSIVIKGLVIQDNHGNKLKTNVLTVEIDIIQLIFENKLKFKNIVVEDAFLIYNQSKTELGTATSFDLSILERIKINKMNFKNFNIDYITSDKTYQFKDLSLNYKEENNYVQMSYNNIDVYQYIPENNYSSKTVIRADISDIVKTIKDFGADKFLDIAQYNKVYSVEGRVRAVISLSKENDEVNYEVNVNLVNNTVQLLSEKLKFENFKGTVNYTKKEGLTSEKLSCTFHDKECSLLMSNKNMKDLFFKFEAVADKSIFSKYIPMLASDTFTGTAKVRGQYNSLFDRPDTMTISSDLVGLNIKKIPIVNKNSTDISPFELYLSNSKESGYLEINNSGVQLFVDLNRDGNTQIFINKEKKEVFKPINANILVDGFIDNAKVVDIVDFINSIKVQKPAKANKPFSYILNITANNPEFLGMKPEKVWLTNDLNVLNIKIQDQMIVGMLRYDLDTKNLNGDFDKVVYKEKSESSNNLEKSFDIHAFPDMRINIQDLQVMDYKGNISFDGRLINNAYVIDNIYGEINELSPNFIIKFAQEKNDSKIETSIVSVNNNKLLEFEDIGKVLTHYGYSNTMTSKKAVIYGSLTWEGLLPNIETLSGDLSFVLEDGRINAVSAGERALNLFRIFELDTLNQLFRMNFDVVKTGIKYSILEGNGSFDSGSFIIDNDHPISMKSDSLNAKLTGKIDFIQELFDNKITIDMPVSQKLPVIALIAGGPAAAAGVWLVDKMVGSKINSLMNLSFIIKGSFAKPKIN